MDHASSTRETTVHGGMGDIYSGRGGASTVGGGIYSGGAIFTVVVREYLQ